MFELLAQSLDRLRLCYECDEDSLNILGTPFGTLSIHRDADEWTITVASWHTHAELENRREAVYYLVGPLCGRARVREHLRGRRVVRAQYEAFVDDQWQVTSDLVFMVPQWPWMRKREHVLEADRLSVDEANQVLDTVAPATIPPA